MADATSLALYDPARPIPDHTCVVHLEGKERTWDGRRSARRLVAL